MLASSFPVKSAALVGDCWKPVCWVIGWIVAAIGCIIRKLFWRWRPRWRHGVAVELEVKPCSFTGKVQM